MQNQIIWNKPYLGISEDDYVATPGQIIEGNNITGLKTGYGWTLGGKSTLLFTPLNPITAMYVDPDVVPGDDTLFGDDDGNFYLGANATPVYTIIDSSYRYIKQIMIMGDWFYFVVGSSETSVNTRIMRVDWAGVRFGNDWSTMNESFVSSFNAQGNPPFYAAKDNLYIGGRENLKQITSAGTASDNAYFNTDIVGLSVQGTQFKVYNENGVVEFWQQGASAISSSQRYPFDIASVEQRGTLDIVTSMDGDLYISSGYTFQRLSKYRSSQRLEDNSQYNGILDFSKGKPSIGTQMINVLGETYITANSDGIPGIYHAGKLIDGLPEKLHKVITTNSSGNAFTEINTLGYDRRERYLFYGWTEGANYGVDYVELKSATTKQYGYFITDIIRGFTNEKNHILAMKMLTSNTSGDNYIKLSQRIDNGTWELVRTISNNTNTIDLESITTENIEFYDIQFKIELYNDLQTENAPILHEFSLKFDLVDNDN